eukprot:gb/GECG01002743.1/.p1 GENE.gb/GECG01002743.1/~~gb/GECG01002743.1/.p1  ORF type:complete len:1025 (+),score=102.79 gb/GECG01002743.1/:1-3075(+)
MHFYGMVLDKVVVLESSVDKVYKTLDRIDSQNSPYARGFRRTPFPTYGTLPIYPSMHHIGHVSKDTLKAVVTGVKQHDPSCDFVLPEPSGTGKTHGMYYLGTSDDFNVLVILSNVVDKTCEDGTQQHKEAMLYTPWRAVDKLMLRLQYAISVDKSPAVAELVSKAAYGAIYLVFLCYLEYVYDVLAMLKHGNGEGARFPIEATDRNLRRAAVFALRNGVGENDVTLMMENRLSSTSLCEVKYITLAGQRKPSEFVIPKKEEISARFKMVVKDLMGLFEKKPVILFAVDEAQALSDKGKGVFLSDSQRHGRSVGDPEGIRLCMEPDLLYAVQKVCANELRSATTSDTGFAVGTIFLGTHYTFREILKRAKISNPVHTNLRVVYTLDTFDVEGIRELVCHYFHLDQCWKSLYDDPSTGFRENIRALQGRGKLMYYLISGLHNLHYDWPGYQNTPPANTLFLRNDLCRCAEEARKYARSFLEGLVARAFKSQKVVADDGMKEAAGVSVLYLLICLDAPHIPVTLDVIQSLVGTSVIPVAVDINEQHFGRILDEPVTKQLIVQEGNRLMKESQTYSDLFRVLSVNMIMRNMYIQHGGLGEDAEGVFCHWILRRMVECSPSSGNVSSLWELLRPALMYVETRADGKECEIPDVKVEAGKIMEELKNVQVRVNSCKNAQDKDERSKVYGEFHWLFEVWTMEQDGASQRQYHFERLLTQISHVAGFDALMPALRIFGNGHSQECAISFQIKIKKQGKLREAAMTTDPDLQFMTDAQRKAAVAGRPVPGGKSESRTKFETLRNAMGEEDAFSRTYRFVVGLQFSSETCERAIMNFGSSWHPLLVLNLGEAIPELRRSKERLSTFIEDMTNMDEDCTLWRGVGQPTFEETEGPSSSSPAQEHSPHSSSVSGSAAPHGSSRGRGKTNKSRRGGALRYKRQRCSAPSSTPKEHSPHASSVSESAYPHESSRGKGKSQKSRGGGSPGPKRRKDPTSSSTAQEHSPHSSSVSGSAHSHGSSRGKKREHRTSTTTWEN